jgi:hypothetical protein
VRLFAGTLHTLQLNANRIIHGLTNNKEQRKQMHMKKELNSSRRLGKNQSHAQCYPDILVINCRSVKNKTSKLSALVQKHYPGVIVLTKTWLDVNVPDKLFCPADYSCVRKDRNIHGGVAILIKSTLTMSESSAHNSNFIIKSDVVIANLHLQIIGIYHPYWKENSVHDFGLKEKLSTIIASDFNGLINRLEEFTLSNRFVQLVDFKTRGNNTLDVLMTDIPNAWIKPEKLSPMDNSDYSVIHVKAFQSKPNVKSWFEWKRITKSENKRRLGTKLAAINWSFLTGTKDVTDCMSPFYKVVIPFKRIKMRDNDKSWITHEIKDPMNRKDKAHKKGTHGLMQTIQQKLSKAIDRALQ